jgi:hypothetical protein
MDVASKIYFWIRVKATVIQVYETPAAVGLVAVNEVEHLAANGFGGLAAEASNRMLERNEELVESLPVVYQPLSSSHQLTICTTDCNNAEANDDTHIINGENSPDIQNYGTFTFYNEKLNTCSLNCAEAFDKTSVKFQKDNNL